MTIPVRCERCARVTAGYDCVRCGAIVCRSHYQLGQERCVDCATAAGTERDPE